jgi:hypothetical protein
MSKLVQLHPENWEKLKQEATQKGTSIAHLLDSIIAQHVGAPPPEQPRAGRPPAATTKLEQEVLECFPDHGTTRAEFLELGDGRPEWTARYRMTVTEIAEETGLSAYQIRRAVALLCRAGALIAADDVARVRGKRTVFEPSWIRMPQ